MQIGRQLNRTTPRLAKEGYSDGLKELVSFALESDPTTRPAMSDILSHSYIAESEEQYPTSSLSELVKIYYQWSQRGGQRISLFHPGGAAAAEVPGESYSDEDWNFSTTDGFERRFSVLDLDQLAASLAEMEEEMDPTAPETSTEKPAEQASTEMSSDERANFDERVRRGAEAMEGIFDEQKPDYKYETKNDFVPVEEKQPSTDLPLRTVTDRSSVMSTFIDIDIGSFDSSHYAAGPTSAQPFQLADAHTIRANKGSGRNRGSIGEQSHASSNEDDDDFTYQQQSGPRPPTMEWKFPTLEPTPEKEPEDDMVSNEESNQAGTEPTEKRATMEWTFPVMGSAAGSDRAPPPHSAEDTIYDTVKAPTTAVRASDASTVDLGEPGDARPSSTVETVDFGEPGDERPSSTVLSVDLGEPGDARPSSSSASEAPSEDSEYDPFRFDRPSTPRAHDSPQHDHFFNKEVPAALNESGYAEFDVPVLDGPGPDEEATHPLWRSSTILTNPESQPEPFPPAGIEFPSILGEPIPDSLDTAKKVPPPPAPEPAGPEPIGFPFIAPPSIESLTEGSGDGPVAAELDRLLGDLLDSLKSTGDALSRVNIGPEQERSDVSVISEEGE